MNKSSGIKSPLVVDPDKEFLKGITANIKEGNIVPLTANVGKDAQLIVSDEKKELSAVFVNLKVMKPDGASVIRSAHQHRPALPVYIIYEGTEPPLSEKELKLLGIQKAVPKPITYDQLMALITPGQLEFNANSAIASGQKNTDQIDAEISTADTDFSSIRAEDFVAGSVCFFDVYVRIAANKYIKILQSGDHFSTERIDAYLKKKVSHFYIRKEMQKHYLAFCDKLSSGLLHSKTASLDIKITQSLNHGEEVFSYFQDNGIDSETIQFAAKFVHNVQDLVKQLEPDKQPSLKDFMDDVTSYDHGVGVSAIAALLFRPMKITSADPIEAVGIASLLHDIGLRKLNPPILDEDESKMTPQQKAVYKDHPALGAKILSTVKGIKPVIIQAVSQHHERRNKRGFPDRIGAGSISIVAEIIGISDEYLRYLQKMKEGTIKNPKFYLESTIFNCFSNSLVTEFKRVFRFGEGDLPKTNSAAGPPKKP